MRSVKGIYDGNNIRFLEEVNEQKPCKVIITFIDEDADIEAIRAYPSDEQTFRFWEENGEDIYNDFLKKKQ